MGEIGHDELVVIPQLDFGVSCLSDVFGLDSQCGKDEMI
jgi:hypothetical protein